MDDLNIIDQFTETFSTYIDSGFGLLGPDVAFLTTVLISIDIPLAGLFWAMDGEANVIGQFLKKVLYVGFFALVLNNFAFLSDVIFDSFAQLGLTATGISLTAADLLKPGFVASTGFEASMPLLEEANALSGFPDFFFNIITISILMFAWLIVLLAFFILAIQLFMTIIEFKLTTLAGFVLIPFALWNKTAFLAEKVLGNVIASGIKLMVLAIIVGIGSTIFATVTASFTPGNVSLQEVAATILASMALLMLGIFVQGIATGLISGAPQLGAGTAVGTALGASAGAVALGAGGIATGRMAVGGVQSAVRAGASLSGGASTAYSLGSAGLSGLPNVGAGMKSVTQAAMAGAQNRFKEGMSAAFGDPASAFRSGAEQAFKDTGGTINAHKLSGGSASNGVPDWANNMRREQLLRDGAMTGAHTISSGDSRGAAEGPNLKRED